MFNVELSVDSVGGHATVALYGELRVADAPGLASHLITAVAACGPSIIVDLAGLELIDACGLKVLVRVLGWTRESGGDMALAAPQPQVRQVLSVTGLIETFSVYPSVEQAASSTRSHVSAECHSGPRPRGHHRGAARARAPMKQPRPPGHPRLNACPLADPLAAGMQKGPSHDRKGPLTW